MKLNQAILLIFAIAVSFPLAAQHKDNGIVVDYNAPASYIVGGVSVDGNSYYSSQQIISLAGLREGMEVTVPGDFISSIVNKIWMQRKFDDVAVVVDSLSSRGDTAFFKIQVKERPRVSRWTFSGVKSGEQKELQERLNLRRGGSFPIMYPRHRPT